MEDFDNYKIFFYILIAILYFLFSGKKKPKPVAKKQVPQQEVVSQKPTFPKQPGQLLKKPETSPKTFETPKPAPFTLEDVLKEFGNTLNEKPEDVKRTVSKEIDEAKPVIIDYDENLVDEEEVISLEKNRGAVIVPGVDQHFNPYILDTKHENKYAALLSNPEGLKTAFVLQEILNKKHF